MVVLLVGLVFFVGGIVLLAFAGPAHMSWWRCFIVVLKGSIPPILVICGLAAIAVGISSIRDKMAAGAQDEPKPTPPGTSKPDES
jgi:uncharacterized membrane protein YdjX (TVP38/TMEM64 family)